MPEDTDFTPKNPKKITLRKSSIDKYGYSLVSNFEPAAQKVITSILDKKYSGSTFSKDPLYLERFLRDLLDIYLNHYIPTRFRSHTRVISEKEYKRLPKKYHGLFKLNSDDNSRIRTYEHPQKWKSNDNERPEWTVILRNKADKDKFLKLSEKLKKCYWASQYGITCAETAENLRTILLELAEITTVKYIRPLWNQERDSKPDYVYQEYIAENDAKDRVLRFKMSLLQAYQRLEREKEYYYQATLQQLKEALHQR